MRLRTTLLWTALAVVSPPKPSRAAEGAGEHESAQPAPGDPATAEASAASPASEPAAPAATPAKEVPPPKRLAVGSGGFFQPGVLLQGWFQADRRTNTASTFRLRRAELHTKGEIVPGLIAYAVMIDPARVLEFQDATLAVRNQEPAPQNPQQAESVIAKQPVSPVAMLQDFFITVTSALVDASIGQFKIPVSWEGYNSSSKLLFPERSLVSREFDDRRDMGLRLTKTFRYFGYSAGLFNGSGQNTLDTNNAKDAALRLEAYPTAGLTIAGVVYATIGERESDVRDRYEADLRFERGPFLFQSEFIRAHDIGKTPPATDGQGFYAAIAWTFLDVLQPCVRVGAVDPDIHADLNPASGGKDEVWQLDAGVNYYLRKNEAKLQVAYSRFFFDSGPANNELIVSTQVAF